MDKSNENPRPSLCLARNEGGLFLPGDIAHAGDPVVKLRLVRFVNVNDFANVL